MSRTAFAIAAVSLSLAGCADPAADPPRLSGASGEGSWQWGGGRPGIDSGHYAAVGDRLVIWSDMKVMRSYSEGDGVYDGKGSVQTIDGAPLDFTFRIGEAEGVIDIGGRSYDLSEGALILVSARKDIALVKQLAADPADLDEPLPFVLKAVAEKDPEIVRFFERDHFTDGTEDAIQADRSSPSASNEQ